MEHETCTTVPGYQLPCRKMFAIQWGNQRSIYIEPLLKHRDAHRKETIISEVFFIRAFLWGLLTSPTPATVASVLVHAHELLDDIRRSGLPLTWSTHGTCSMLRRNRMRLWTTVVVGYNTWDETCRGGSRVISRRIQVEDIEPDGMPLLSVLAACRDLGAVSGCMYLCSTEARRRYLKVWIGVYDLDGANYCWYVLARAGEKYGAD